MRLYGDGATSLLVPALLLLLLLLSLFVLVEAKELDRVVGSTCRTARVQDVISSGTRSK